MPNELAPLPRHQHELSDEAFLAEFDFGLSALGSVAAALAADNLPAAKAALVTHFLERPSGKLQKLCMAVLNREAFSPE